jgi:hypothetical protein
LNLWRSKITSQFKRTIESIFPSHTSRVVPPQRRSERTASRVKRIQAGTPPAFPATASDIALRRGSDHFTTYTRGSYLARSRGEARSRRPLFRIR